MAAVGLSNKGFFHLGLFVPIYAGIRMNANVAVSNFLNGIMFLVFKVKKGLLSLWLCFFFFLVYTGNTCVLRGGGGVAGLCKLKYFFLCLVTFLKPWGHTFLQHLSMEKSKSCSLKM